MKRPGYAYFALFVGVLSVSCGAIFTRYAQDGAPSLTIAAYRMGLAFIVVLVPTWIKHRHKLLSLTNRDFTLAATSGLFLAVHFATWIYSLEFTTVAISVVMVNTAPLWVVLLTVLVTRKSLSKSKLLSIAIAVVGAVMMSWDIASGGNSSSDLFGAILAITGAIGLAAYLLIGHSLQQRHSLCVYLTICYGTAAGYLGLAAIVTRRQLIGYSFATWCYILGLALVSQALGHSANNWALRFLSASMVSVALLGEPILSTLYAYVLFDETLTFVQAGGAAMILFGIYLAIRTE